MQTTTINPHDYKGHKVSNTLGTWIAEKENRLFAASSLDKLYKLIDKRKK